MLVALWIVLALLAALTALAQLRIGFHAALSVGVVTAEIRIGPLRIPLYATGAKQTSSEPSAAARGQKPPEGRGKSAGKSFQFSLSDLRAGWNALREPLRQTLTRLRRDIRVRPLRLHVTFGGAGDPAGAAETYGCACALMWTILPALEEFIDIRDPAIHLGVDYDAAGTAAEGEIGVSMRLGTLLAMALGMGIPALRWLSGLKKQQKQPPQHTAARTT